MGWRDDFIGQKFNCRYSGSHFYSQGLKIKFYTDASLCKSPNFNGCLGYQEIVKIESLRS